MKEKYLEELRERLEDRDISDVEINDVIDDYSEMIDDALNKNMSEDEIYNLIGSPKQVVRELKDQLHADGETESDNDYFSHEKVVRSNKIVALMPFISVTIFMVLGLVWNLWNPGWLVFLLIPVVAILVNVFRKGKLMEGLVAIRPFLATVTYLTIGFSTSVWHPTWLIFLIIPILGIFTGAKRMNILNLLTALSPFISIIAYFLIGYYYGVWHPTWMIFFIIPILGILNESNIWKLIALEGSILISSAVYLFIGYEYGVWGLSAFVFLIPLGLSIILSEDKSWRINKENRFLFLLTLVLIAIYFIFGFTFNTWAYLWMIFLFVPVTAILKNVHDKNQIVALMPFISVIIFFTVGYFFHMWEFSWIAFLLIPVTAIIKNA